MSNHAKMIVLIILTAILGLLLAVCARLESRTFPAAPTAPEATVSTGPAESCDTTAATEEPSKPIEVTETSAPPETTAPATEPTVTEAPETEPKETQKPASKPSGTKPKPTDPPTTEPPATEPPATSPSPTESVGNLGDIEDGLGWG